MEIQGLTKTTAAGQLAAVSAAADEAAPTNAFASLLDLVGANFNGGMSTSAMDTKLMRAADEAASAKRGEEPREVGKLREDPSEDRAAAKPKAAKTEDDEDDTSSDETDTVSENTDNTDDAAAPAQTANDQAVAQVVDGIAVETLLATAEVIAPVLIAQQVVAAVDTTVAQQTAVAVVQAVAATEVVATDTGAALTDAPKSAAVEAPAAVEKSADTNTPKFQQVLAAATSAQQTAAEQTVTVEAAQGGEQTAAKSKDSAQAAQVTQRSAAAQEQSQALSQQLGGEVKAKVQVSVHGHAAANQTLADNSPYNIYAGYNGGQASTANGQVGIADASNALVQGSKSPAEQVQAQPSPASPPVALPSQTPAAQQGASSSAIRADVAAPAPAQAGNTGGQPSTGFSSGFSNTQANAETSAATQANNPEKPAATAQQVIDQIKVNITRAAKAGLDRVTIQLKPQELGRIDVQLEMSEDHKVRVTVTADNKDTLALLQSDSRTLERALNDAGLRTDTSNLHFNLRSESDPRTADGSQHGGNGDASAADGDEADADDETSYLFDYAAAARARGGVDTFA